MKKYIFLTLPLFLNIACNQSPAPAAKADAITNQQRVTLTDDQIKQAGIVSGTITEKEISEHLKFFGIIDVPPQNMISVSLPLGGFLQSTQLLPGMHVSKNEVIATVEDQQFIVLQQEYLTAKSKLNVIEKEYQRQKELNKNKVSSDKNLQISESEFTTQKINVKSMAEKLRLIHLNPDALNESNLSRSIKVYSPISGFVKKVNVNIGKYVLPSEVLFELVNPEDIHLNLKVFDKDLGKLSIGQKVIAFNNTQPNVKYPCEIILISKDLKADRSAEVHCHFERYDHLLLPGMYMNAEVSIDSKKVFCLPADAIVSFANQNYVFVKLNTHEFEMIPVQTGTANDGYISITNAIDINSSKKEFVINGAYSLLMQLKNSGE